MTRRWPWNGDLTHFLACLPQPYFRNRDAYDVADRLGVARWNGQAAWHRLKLEGRIVRTRVPIGRSTRRCYWERSWCSIRITDQNRTWIAALVNISRK